MNWLEVTVNTHSESVEVVSSILIELGSKGVSIDDPQDYYQLTDEQLEWLKVQQKDLYETDTVIVKGDRKSTRLNSSHIQKSRMPSSA